jgi:hypothetical protein
MSQQHPNGPTCLLVLVKAFTQWALNKGIYAIPFELIKKGHNTIPLNSG